MSHPGNRTPAPLSWWPPDWPTRGIRPGSRMKTPTSARGFGEWLHLAHARSGLASRENRAVRELSAIHRGFSALVVALTRQRTPVPRGRRCGLFLPGSPPSFQSSGHAVGVLPRSLAHSIVGLLCRDSIPPRVAVSHRVRLISDHSRTLFRSSSVFTPR
jgi:hypothetical protein